VYGGPSVQYVCDSWISTVDMRAQYLRSKGILVWKVSVLNIDVLAVYLI
jgi:dipeptidyl-peptidase-4